MGWGKEGRACERVGGGARTANTQAKHKTQNTTKHNKTRQNTTKHDKTQTLTHQKQQGIIEGLSKLRGAVQKEQKEEREIAEKVLAWVEAGNDVRFGDWSLREVEALNTWCVWRARAALGGLRPACAAARFAF